MSHTRYLYFFAPNLTCRARNETRILLAPSGSNAHQFGRTIPLGPSVFLQTGSQAFRRPEFHQAKRKKIPGPAASTPKHEADRSTFKLHRYFQELFFQVRDICCDKRKLPWHIPAAMPVSCVPPVVSYPNPICARVRLTLSHHPHAPMARSRLHSSFWHDLEPGCAFRRHCRGVSPGSAP